MSFLSMGLKTAKVPLSLFADNRKKLVEGMQARWHPTVSDATNIGTCLASATVGLSMAGKLKRAKYNN